MYIIKHHYEATTTNRNFAGEAQDWYTGKGGFIMGGRDIFPSAWEINRSGYSTLASAKRALKAALNGAERETEQGWWKVTVELIEC